MSKFPQELLDGYANFMAGRYANEETRYRELAEEGQAPDTMIIACCDSRAAPETIFDCGPGTLFVARNVANLVPPFLPDGAFHSTSAALEYAVFGLEVKNIIVMGHGRCGGIHAALNPDDLPPSSGDFIIKWLTLLADVAAKLKSTDVLTDAERQTALERISIRNSITNLRTFPRVKELEEAGKLHLHGAWFDISTGELWVMDPENGDFRRPNMD